MAREPLTRAEFLKILMAGAGGIVFLRGSEDALAALAGADDDLDQAALDGDLGRGGLPYLTVVHGTPVAANVKTAIAKLGGMRRFVSAGDDVVIKPNICAPRAPKYAVTTNPVVVATLVRLARGAGAKRVRVMDYPISSSASSCYSKSGIASAVKAAGGSMKIMSAGTGWATYAIPGGRLGRQSLYKAIVGCDALINVPIAKQHGSTGLTLAGKNMMGCTRDRGRMHTLGLSRTIAELNAKLRPDLTVLDAIRILIRHGPTGGSLADVRRKDIVIAGRDWVAVDAYATRLFGKKPGFVPYIAAAAKMGLGKADLTGLAIRKYEV